MLSRKVGQSIMIADNVRVTVVGIQGNKVRLGIVAPEGTSVDRLEIRWSPPAGTAPAVGEPFAVAQTPRQTASGYVGTNSPTGFWSWRMTALPNTAPTAPSTTRWSSDSDR